MNKAINLVSLSGGGAILNQQAVAELASLCEWLAQAGLTTVCVEILPTKMVKPDVVSMPGWIRSTCMPYTERREEYIAELVNEYS